VAQGTPIRKSSTSTGSKCARPQGTYSAATPSAAPSYHDQQPTNDFFAEASRAVFQLQYARFPRDLESAHHRQCAGGTIVGRDETSDGNIKTSI